MPVREAFQILAADGLTKVRPNKGAVVLGINEQTIREHIPEIRALLEKVRRWLKRRHGTDISRITRVHYAAEKKILAENARRNTPTLSGISYGNGMLLATKNENVAL